MIQSSEWWNRWCKLWEDVGYVDDLYQKVWWRGFAEVFGTIGLEFFMGRTYPLWVPK